MKLYFSPGACSLSVRILLNELNIPAEYEAVDLKTKKTQSGNDFKKINPKGSVPTLITDQNEVLTENIVIHQFLADQKKAYELLPALQDFNRYKVLEQSSYLCSDFHKSFTPLFNPEIPIDMKEKFFIPALKAKLTFLNNHLSDKKYLATENFTIADAYLFVMLRWVKAFEIHLSEWPAIEKYFNNLKTRKSIQKSLEEEKQN